MFNPLIIKVMKVELKPLKRYAWANNVYKYPNCHDDITPYWTRSGRIYTGLTVKDEKRLGDLLNVSITPESEYWKEFYIRIGANPVYLDTDRPEDELKYLFLKNHKRVKTSYSEHKATADYIMINKEEEARRENVYNKIKRRAIREFDKLSIEDMRKCMRLYNYNTDSLSSEEIEKMLFNFIEEDPQKFLRVWVDNEDRETLFLIENAISKNVIRKNKNIYRYGSDAIGRSLDEVIAFLNHPKNQDIRIAIIRQIETKEKMLRSDIKTPSDIENMLKSISKDIDTDNKDDVKKDEEVPNKVEEFKDEAQERFNEMLMKEEEQVDDVKPPSKKKISSKSVKKKSK